MIKKEDIKVGLVFDYPVFKIDPNELSIIRSFVPEGKSATARFQIRNISEVRENPLYADCYCLNARKDISVMISLSGIEEYGAFFTSIAECERIKKEIDHFSGMLSELSDDKMNKQKEILREPCKAFKAITDKMVDTYRRKNHDYGNAFSEMYDELGINYGYGKIREKVNRIKTLKDNEAQVANEPLEDALLDCANYCILTLVEYQKRKEHVTD